jgi:GST-like protein
MIDLHYWTTPNGHKVTMFLEETGIPYRIVPVNIRQNDQYKEGFLTIAPNNKIPAIVDHEPVGGGPPLSIFESGAILQYRVRKSGQLIPADVRGQTEATQSVYWQVGGLGPMLGQLVLFVRAQEKISVAIDRYTREAARLFGVPNKRLEGRDWLAGSGYSIADIATFPWVVPYGLFGLTLDEYPHIARWLNAIVARPDTQPQRPSRAQ